MTLNMHLGETHCDTIGDFFKNPFLYRCVKEYYEVNYKDATLFPLRKGKAFTSEFYECIRDIFSSYGQMKDFLRRIRTEYKESPKSLETYSPDQCTQALLVFEQLYQYLSTDASDSFSVSGLFQKSVADIVLERKREFLYLAKKEAETGPLDTKNSLYSGLLDAVNLGIALTSDGRIVYLQEKVRENVFLVVELGSFEEIEVNQHGTLKTPFQKPQLTIVVNGEVGPEGKDAIGKGRGEPRIDLRIVK